MAKGDLIDLEQALVSDRLNRVESRLTRLEDIAVSSDSRLARLVELAENKESREQADIEERTANRRWLRKVLKPELLLPYILAAVTGAAVGGSSLPITGATNAIEVSE